MLVHALAPPTPGGTPVVLERLLTDLPGVRLEVVTDRALRRRVRAGRGRILPGRYRYFWKWPGWGGSLRAGRIAAAAIDLLLAVVAGLRAARWARRDGVRWIMSVTDEGFSPIAGAVAARAARLPHVIMVFDLWEENAYSDVQRAVARRLEGPIFRSAAKVVGYCEEIVDYLDTKHGADATFIRTPGPPPPRDGSAELLMAGAIYWVQEESVKRVLRVAPRVPGLRTVMIADAAQLALAGVHADAVEAPMDPHAYRKRIERADILCLGLSFETAHQQVVLTGTPARLPDFLATARPVVIHAPPDSHVARYCRREGLAEVVDVPDEAALEAALRRVLEDRDEALARAARAREHVKRVHDPAKVRERFAAVLKALTGP
jgi:hypothetical protein